MYRNHKERYASLMRKTCDRAQQFQALSASFNETGFRFLSEDLDTAIIFAEMGLNTTDPEKRKRNHKNARTAHDTVLKIMTRLNLNDSESETIQRKIERLETHLRVLERTTA